MEGWLSGRKRRSWKPLNRKVPWVRIPPSPPSTHTARDNHRDLSRLHGLQAEHYKWAVRLMIMSSINSCRLFSCCGPLKITLSANTKWLRREWRTLPETGLTKRWINASWRPFWQPGVVICKQFQHHQDGREVGLQPPLSGRHIPASWHSWLWS